MRPAFNLAINPIDYYTSGLIESDLEFAAQFGVKDLILSSYDFGGLLPGESRWELEDIINLKTRVENHGMKIFCIENVPNRFYEDIMLNGPSREKQIDNMIYTIRNIAKAEIPVFGYHWMPNIVWRTNRNKIIRGKAVVTEFDYSIVQKGFENNHIVDGRPPLTHGRIYTEDEMWNNLEYWINIITPVAEEEGIKLGIHPCDPPVPMLGGIAQIFRSFESYKRLINIYPSDHNAVEFCQGTFSEMKGENIYEMIRYFGKRNKILYVHFRNVSGQVPKFHEEFINTGYVDMYKAMELYNEIGLQGVITDDHVPMVVGDTPFCHRGRAFANGYIQATIEAVKRNN